MAEMNSFMKALPGVFDAIEASEEVRQAFVFAAWRSVAGGQVAQRTSPLTVEDGRLVIAVADKTWKRNLETLAAQLLFRLNASLGKPMIDFIEFRIDRSVFELSGRGHTRPEPPAPAPPVELSVSARKIRDEALRETVLKAAANCIARQE